MNEVLEGLTIVKFFLKMRSGLKKRILRGKRLESSVASLQQEVSNLDEKFTDLQKENTQLKKDFRKIFEEQSFDHIEINGTVVSVPKGKSNPYYCTMCKGVPLKQLNDPRMRESHYCPSCREPFALK